MATPAPQRDLFEDSNIVTVSELTTMIKEAIDEAIPTVWVSGEVSNFRRHESGHLYFSLKDEGAVINCAVWRSRAGSIKFDVENGQKVIAQGYVDVYAPKGGYTLIVQQMEPKGLGVLQLRFEQLKKKLSAEGLFEASRKRPIPFLPRTIAIVTSKTGAAVHDIINTILKRWPKPEIYVADVRVQGAGAADEVADMIHRLNTKMPWLDVMIVGRGGGSIEDLWAFNEEVVVRAIAASKIPTISAVGHEVDVTLADLAADVRAKTPTDAGTLVVPEYAQLVQRLEELKTQLDKKLQGTLDEMFMKVDHLRDSFGFRNTEQSATLRREQLAELSRRLAQGLASSTRTAREALRRHVEHYLMSDPGRIVQAFARSAQLEEKEHALGQILEHRLRQSREMVSSFAGQLDALSPLKVLARGYSITRHQGHVVMDASNVPSGQVIETRLRTGTLRSKTL